MTAAATTESKQRINLAATRVGQPSIGAGLQDMAAKPRRLGRLAALVFAAAALMPILPEAATAASRICRQLEAELASAGRPSTTQSRKQDASIARQREQLQLARRQARDAGCGFRLFGGGSSSCKAINAKIGKMERNLQTLERRRSSTADSSSGRSRSQVMAALEANGCRDEAIAERRLPPALDGTRNLLDQIFGGGLRQRGSIDGLGEPLRRDERQVRRLPEALEGGWVNDGGRIRYSAPPGRYRTLCVRTCDGYYFPVSGASSPSDFDRDQANCQSSCPGTEVQIYYHRPGQESETMLSGLSGRPYADLPTAWLYKQPGTPTPAGCACSALRNDGTKNFSIIAGNPPAGRTVPPEPAASSAQPASGAKPDTFATDAGEEKKVRVVGPAFLPDPEAAADPQAPDPNPVR